MSTHATLSPSSAVRWLNCPGSIGLGANLPKEVSSTYADEGTAAHWLAALCLESGKNATGLVGSHIYVFTDGSCEFDKRTPPERMKDFSSGHGVDVDFAAAVQVYLDNVREYAVGSELMVEQRLSISHITGESQAFGTADAVILQGNTLQVHDLKFGKGEQVEAEENDQLIIYALAALEQFGMLGDFDQVMMAIHQPRLNHLSEWSTSVEDLLARIPRIRQLGDGILSGELDGEIYPGAAQCRWCPAKAICPGLRDQVMEEFEAIESYDATTEVPADELAKAMASVPLIEAWCKAVRAETERRLCANIPVPGYKLVQGRKGARAWKDQEEAETTLKAMRLKQDDMYSRTLISPTVAEKLAKAGILGAKQWDKLQPLITQPDGKPSVTEESDPRPAYNNAADVDEFDLV